MKVAGTQNIYMVLSILKTTGEFQKFSPNICFVMHMYHRRKCTNQFDYANGLSFGVLS